MAKKLTARDLFVKELKIGVHAGEAYLKEKGYEDIKLKPTTKLEGEILEILLEKYDTDGRIRAKYFPKEEPAPTEEKVSAEPAPEKTESASAETEQKAEPEEPIIKGPKIVGKVDLDKDKKKKKKAAKAEEPEKPKAEKPVDKAPEPAPEAQKPVEETPAEPAPEEKPAPEPQEAAAETVHPEVEEPEAEKEPAPQPEAKEAPAEEKPSEPTHIETKKPAELKLNFTGEKIDLDKLDPTTRPKKKTKAERKKAEEAKAANKPKKKRRKKVLRTKPGATADKAKKNLDQEAIDAKIKKELQERWERLQAKEGTKKKAKRLKRERKREKLAKLLAEQEREERTLRVAEFATVSELAGLMNVDPTEIIAKAFEELGMITTVNQRLDKETIELLAEEFGYEVEFADVEEVDDVEEETADNPEDLEQRPPVVTIMGHVDHGKTSLLDYIRNTNVVAGEAGGITQHIGAYNVTLPDGQRITFLDTPGHEAFTAMRARGTQVTDIAVIVIAADDDIMPQTKEAINHAKAAGVPIIFAINKVDKPTADPEKIKNKLAQMNLLVEEWGGEYQSKDISAKTGQGVDDLLEEILTRAELMELKANPKRLASGTVLEASLEKGKGYTANILVQNGTLRIGDYVVAGRNHGKVRAMYDERGNRIKEAGPSMPVQIIGLDGAPRAGDKFKVYADEKEAKKIAQKRDQIYREQQLRARRHITLDEIGRRLQLGEFKELNLIIKGDVDGSVEALSDALVKLSNEKVEVRIIHKGVGQITEADVNLAAASDAIIIGFNVRPSGKAAQLAQEEGVQIKTYSIIYEVIDDVKAALENMLSPVEREEVTGTAEVRQTFKISKVGTVAGCMVTSGKIYNKSRVRVIRDGIVIHDGELSSLKRYKDDVKEVSKGYECGLTIKNFNNIKEGDVIEAYQVKMEKQKL
ncbi:MAG: translation initiation factor IF-2 [Chlorobi bacterium]|nr:translation initiation factor IF-2 [Chlorobiota bacterium]